MLTVLHGTNACAETVMVIYHVKRIIGTN